MIKDQIKDQNLRIESLAEAVENSNNQGASQQAVLESYDESVINIENQGASQQDARNANQGASQKDNIKVIC